MRDDDITIRAATVRKRCDIRRGKRSLTVAARMGTTFSGAMSTFNGAVTTRLVDDSKMTQPDAAVAIVHARGPAESVLLIRRSERASDPWSGHWSFPGGRRHPEDRDPLDTALRELAEECGIRLTRDQMESTLPYTVARRLTPPYVLVAPFIFAVSEELPTVLDPREAAAALWVPLRDLRDPARHALRPIPGRPAATLYPCVELQGTPLWGFTYRLLSDWLTLPPGP